MNSLNLISADLKLHRLAGVDIAFLYESMSLNDYKQLPFTVMPMLSLGDTRSADIDADLSAILGVDQFGK